MKMGMMLGENVTDVRWLVEGPGYWDETLKDLGWSRDETSKYPRCK